MCPLHVRLTRHLLTVTMMACRITKMLFPTTSTVDCVDADGDRYSGACTDCNDEYSLYCQLRMIKTAMVSLFMNDNCAVIKMLNTHYCWRGWACLMVLESHLSDCDDTDTTSEITATDGDFDGALTVDDCNDQDQSSSFQVLLRLEVRWCSLH